MRNRGFDFTIGADIIKTKDWYWNVKLSGNYNKNEISSSSRTYWTLTCWAISKMLKWDTMSASSTWFAGATLTPTDGQGCMKHWDGNYAGFLRSKPRADRQSWSNPWSGGISTTVAWKGIQLDVQYRNVRPLLVEQRTLVARRPLGQWKVQHDDRDARHGGACATFVRRFPASVM